MATAGTVTIRLDGDSATLIRELNKANEAANSTFASMKREAGEMAGKFAVIASAAAVAFAALTKHSFEAVDALAKQADRLGITTESLKTMQVAADLAGVAQETLVKSLQKQQKLLVSAADGSKEAADTFRQLGLNVQDVIALPADQQFQKIAQALDGVENVSRRNALAMQVWGDRAAEMINFAASAGDGVGDLSVLLGDLNVTVSRFDAEKISNAGDAVNIAKLAFEGLGNTIAVAVAPYVTALAGQFTEAARSSGGFKDQVATAMQFVANAVGFAGDTIRGLEVIFKSVAAAGLYAAGAIAKAFGFLFDGKAMQEFGDNARGAAADLGREVAEALNRPMPSVAIDKWFADAKAKADAAGAEIAAKMGGGAGKGGAPDTIGQNDAAQAESLRKWLEQMKADAANAKAIAPTVITPEIKPGEFLPDPAVTRQFADMEAQQYLEAWQLANQQRAEAEQTLRDTLLQGDAQAGQALIELAAQQAREKVAAEFQARGEAMGENGQFLDPQAQAEYEAQVQAETLSREQSFLQQRLALQQKFGTQYSGLQMAMAKLFGKTWTDTHKQTLTATATFASSAMSIVTSLFGQHKGVAIAMSIINTLQAATLALNSAPGPLGIAQAAAVLATGFAQVSQIRSTSIGGGGGVGGISGGFGGGGVTTPPSLGGFAGDGTDQQSRGQVTIQFMGPMYGYDRFVQEKIITGIRDAVDGRDIVLFGGDSRQASIIRGSG